MKPSYLAFLASAGCAQSLHGNTTGVLANNAHSDQGVLEARFANLERMEARFAKLESDNALLQSQNADLKAEGGALVGELKVFEADECPPGWRESNSTQGYMLTGRPKGGAAGTRINRPLDAGEVLRSPEHTHAVTATDLGHTHVGTVHDPGHVHTITDPGHTHPITDPGHVHTVTDPGHTHTVSDPGHTHPIYSTGSTPGGTIIGAYAGPPPYALATTTTYPSQSSTTGISVAAQSAGISLASHTTGIAGTNSAPAGVTGTNGALTGIVISNAPAKSNIEVSMDANEGGEAYPLVYVLICERVPVSGGGDRDREARAQPAEVSEQ